MPLDITIVVTGITFLWGGIIIWSNPRRNINVLAGTMSLHVALWLLFRYNAAKSSESLTWIRWTIAIGGFIPAHLRIFLDAIALPGVSYRKLVLKSARWILTSAVLTSIVFTNWFIPESSNPFRPRSGVGYAVYFVGLLLQYLILIISARRIAKTKSGIERLELDLILIGGACTAIVVLVLMVVKRLFMLPLPQHVQTIVVFSLFAGLCIAVTTGKIFDARYLLLLGLRGCVAFGSVWFLAYGTGQFLREFTGSIFSSLVVTGAVLLSYRPINRMWSRVFRMFPKDAEVRHAAFEVAKRTSRRADLDIEFERILRAWSQCERVEIFSGGIDQDSFDPALPDELRSCLAFIKGVRWITPERLVRERQDSERTRALKALGERRYGLLIYCSNSIGQVLIGIGDRPSRRPYTYPDVRLVLEIGSIMEACYSQCILATRANEAERLATVGVLGASVAHEIRNPLVTIKAFVQLLPTQYESADFRQKFSRLIGEEVGRIERLTEQLLDLAAPRKYILRTYDLHVILKESLDLFQIQAQERNVKLETEFLATRVHINTDPAAVRQILMNLCFNAMQAQERQTRERWIRISTVQSDDGVNLLVTDNGPGIENGLKDRLFKAFQTSKSSGFGLGLAICMEIARNIGAEISLDKCYGGCGARFKVSFSCQRHLYY